MLQNLCRNDCVEVQRFYFQIRKPSHDLRVNSRSIGLGKWGSIIVFESSNLTISIMAIASVDWNESPIEVRPAGEVEDSETIK